MKYGANGYDQTRLGSRAAEFGVALECRTYGARVVLQPIPSPSGLGYVWTAGPPGLDKLLVAHFIVTAQLVTVKRCRKRANLDKSVGAVSRQID
jgi:hypothetical protein